MNNKKLMEIFITRLIRNLRNAIVFIQYNVKSKIIYIIPLCILLLSLFFSPRYFKLIEGNSDGKKELKKTTKDSDRGKTAYNLLDEHL